jgi:hypothetical protein
MNKAYHDTMSVISVGIAQKPAAESVGAIKFFIDNSTIQFYCAETSPVTVSMYALNGRFIKTLFDQTLTKGSHSVRFDAKNGSAPGMTPGLYTVRLKIKDREYFGQLNNL